jgi:hypothetical protein
MRTALLATLAAVTPFVVASTADAARPEATSFVMHTTFDDVPDQVFDVTGALAPGCVAGTAVDTWFRAAPSDEFWPTPSGIAALGVGKVMTCEGGQLALRLNVVLDLETNETSGVWTVAGGTGIYAGAHGHGTISGSPFPDGIDDTFTGVVQLAD